MSAIWSVMARAWLVLWNEFIYLLKGVSICISSLFFAKLTGKYLFSDPLYPLKKV